ncbi:sulfonate ABC transporter substrate-binding protein [Bacillus sp. V5-8f]|uniref:sulfonate ABC transporter substrate-binding protein n=1 Tax=Bacillus sp. V5-8f TaxID=2053044 RepID=UPI000C757024|nr:sulfonate ABC transporter substrate-binding protein [Bacillus sp. V5-8f]PLT33670.1 aliphatic sulfonate ABC transporter substrate-binding protein [Bacillus sp. V5-8f]
MRRKKCVSLLFSIFSFICITCFLLAGCSEGTVNKKEDESAQKKSISEDKTIKIGYQKNGPLVILKSLGSLEKRLEPMGYHVEWKEFTAGPALLEALNVGSIDFGRTGDSPPIFAQAADAPFVYVAAGKTKVEGSGILVPKDSEIKSLEDLRGKKIGFAKGSSSHFLLVKALKKASISYEDIKPSFLQPGDARVAFEKGNIDAWVIWDPFTADTQIHSKARMLVNGEGLTTDRDFFLANIEFTKNHGEAVDIIVEEIKKSSDWANSNHQDLVKMMSPLLKIDEQSLLMSAQRRLYGVDPLTEDIVKEQQEIADTYFEMKIIPKKINVLNAMDKERMVKK